MADIISSNFTLFLICTVIWALSFFIGLAIILSVSRRHMSFASFINWTVVLKHLSLREKTTFYISFLLCLVLTLPSIAFIAETLKAMQVP